MPKAEQALKSAPGVLAVKVDYEAKRATIGTKKGVPISAADIAAALESIGYTAKIVEDPAEMLSSEQ